MSPMREDVKEKLFVRPLRGAVDLAICIQPDLSSGEVLGSRRAPDRPRQTAVSTRWSHDAMVRRLRFREATQANGVALEIGQPWSYLRLEAYSFFGLCEGA
jgi:hypothetical protein